MPHKIYLLQRFLESTEAGNKNSDKNKAIYNGFKER